MSMTKEKVFSVGQEPYVKVVYGATGIMSFYVHSRSGQWVPKDIDDLRRSFDKDFQRFEIEMIKEYDRQYDDQPLE